MIFPAYSELENRNIARFSLVSLWMTLIYTIALLSIATIAVLLFGGSLEPDMLENLVARPGRLSVFMRTVYCLILLLHVQYYSFAIKEYCLVVYDEIVNRSISTTVEAKLQ